jgi:nucleotide-binding universal stress UspA family protein
VSAAGWPDGTLAARSLDPTVDEEADFPSGHVRLGLETLLGQPGGRWSFRVLNGDVSQALARLAESTGASLLVVGAGRPGALAWIDRLLEGSVSASLLCRQERPVLIVPDGG